MDVIAVPEAISRQPQISCGDIAFVDYREKGCFFRNRVVFNRTSISFVLNGQKEIYRAGERTVIHEGQALVIPEGNSLGAEHSLNDDKYSSFITFFPSQLAIDFIAKHHIVQPEIPAPAFLHFTATPHLAGYVHGLQQLVQGGHRLSAAIMQHKLEELLLAIYELFPAKFAALFGKREQLPLKKLIEDHLYHNLTLEELAFLANRSLSSFKRDFERTYGISPQKYIRESKLEAARAELESGKQASQLYTAYGYDNLSNFSSAFKRKFGVTPGIYRSGK